MDYPVSVAGVGLVNGKFTDGNPQVGVAASLDPSEWANLVTDEMLNIVMAAGLIPSETANNQLAIAIQSGLLNYGADTGVANAYVVALDPVVTSLSSGSRFRFLALHANNGACTLNVGTGPLPLVGLGGSALQSGEILALSVVDVEYVGAAGFVLLSATGGALPVAPGTQSNHAVNVSQLFGSRNKIINGSMNVDARQNGALVSQTSTRTYTVDKWRFDCSVANVFSAQQQSNATNSSSSAPGSSLLITTTTAYAPTAIDYLIVAQFIEGNNCADLYWGTPQAKPVSMQFKVKTSVSGTYSVSLYNNTPGNPRSLVLTFNVPTANTWTTIKLQNIPGDTVAPWNFGATTNLGIEVRFSLGAGTNFTCPAGSIGAWNGNNYVAGAGSVATCTTANSTFQVTDIQIEQGPVCTPYEARPIQTESLLCKRYFQRLFGGFSGSVTSGQNYGCYLQSAVDMRVAPVITWIGVAGASNSFPTTAPSGISGLTTSSPLSLSPYRTANATGSAGFYSDTYALDADF